MPLFSEIRCAVRKEERKAVIVMESKDQNRTAHNNASPLEKET
jgi:hypothetical protein